MALSFDLTGLPLLENEVAALVAAQQASPSIFTGGATFNTTFVGAKSGTVPGTGGAPALPGPGTMTTAALVQRLQALLSLAQTLPV
jgi:hypothetical protein